MADKYCITCEHYIQHHLYKDAKRAMCKMYDTRYFSNVQGMEVFKPGPHPVTMEEIREDACKGNWWKSRILADALSGLTFTSKKPSSLKTSLEDLD